MLSLGNESLGVNLAFLQNEPFLFFFGNEKTTTFYPLSSPLLLRITYFCFQTTAPGLSGCRFPATYVFGE